MFRKIFFIAVVLGALNLQADPDQDADKLADIAVKSNPDSEMLKAQIKALDSNISASRVWMDPSFMTEYSSMPIDKPYPGNHAMSGIVLKITQTFPFPGKNDRRENVAKQMKKVKEIEINEWENELRSKVKQAYWNLAGTRILRKITGDHILLVDQMISAVKAKYESGVSSQYNLMRLSVVKEILTDELDDYSKNERSLIAAVNSALNREIDSEISTPDEIPLLAQQTSLDELMKKGSKNRPLVKIWNEKSRLEKLEAEKVRFERMPDLTFFASYRFRTRSGMDDGTDFFSIGFSMPLPFDYTGHFKSKSSVFKFNDLAARSKAESIVNDMRREIEQSLAEWERGYKQAVNYETKIIPDNKKVLESALSSYQVGKLDFEPIYQSGIMEIMFEKKVVMSKIQPHLMKARIEMLTGSNIDEEAGHEK